MFFGSVDRGYDVNILQPSVFICELLNFRGVEIINCWNIVAYNWGTTFHFNCVQPALVELEVLFSQLCTFQRDCAGIARQAFQYSGSVAYLFHLTVAAVLEGDAVCISDRSRLLTSNLTLHARINYLCWQVFFIATVPLERECVRAVYSFVAQRRVPLAFASPYQANFRMHHTII